VSLYCTVYLVMPVSADGLRIVFGLLTIKLEQLWLEPMCRGTKVSEGSSNLNNGDPSEVPVTINDVLSGAKNQSKRKELNYV